MKYSKNDLIEIYFDYNGEKLSQRFLVLDEGSVSETYNPLGDVEAFYYVLDGNCEKRAISIFETESRDKDYVRYIDGIKNANVRRM